MNPVIHNMLVTKDIGNKLFNYIEPWSENLASIKWSIRASYHHTIWSTPDQSALGIYMILKTVSLVDW